MNSSRTARRRHRRVVNAGRWLAATTSLALGFGALAQQTSSPGGPAPAASAAGTSPAPDAASKDAAGGIATLDRVEITAGKRRQNQRDIAGTVSVQSGAALEARGAADAEDVFRAVPGVQFNKGGADASLLSIRGVGTNTTSENVIFGQTPTGIYIEDVPFTDPYVYISTPDVAPFDLERVEVLRGPQGALYGASSLGGAVRYLFNKPDVNATEFSLLGSVNSVSQGGTGYATYAMANLPLKQGVAALRLVANKRKDPGYIDNLGTGRKDANVVNAEGMRLLLAFKPSTDFDLTALYMRQRSRQDDGSAISPDPSRLEISTPTASTVDSVFDLTSLQANLNLGSLRLTSITGYQTKRRDQDADFTRYQVPDFSMSTDYGPYPGVTSAINVERRHSNTVSQEFRLAPQQAGAVNWLAGLSHQRVSFYRTQQNIWPGTNDPANAPNDVVWDTLRTGTATENAVFGDVDVKATVKLNIGIGARYFQTQVKFVRSQPATLFGGAANTPLETSESGTTPKLSARYQFTPQTSVYALASRGYRFGGINTRQSLPYRSDSLWNYETGLRLAPAAGVTLDVSVFYLDWKDVQISTADSAGFIVISNVEKAKSTGLEAALSWRPSGTLSLTASAAYTRAITDSPFRAATGKIVPVGSNLPGTARLQASADATLAFDGPAGTAGRFSTLLSYVGERTPEIGSARVLPAYTTLDMRLSFQLGSWQLSAFAQNLADKRGLSSSTSATYSYIAGGYTDYFPIRPRTLGLALRYDL